MYFDSREVRVMQPGQAPILRSNSAKGLRPQPSAEPERARFVPWFFLQNWTGASQFVRIFMRQVIHHGQYFKGAIKAQKRLENILLVPKIALLQYPSRRVVARRKYVMDVDYHAGTKQAQQTKIYVCNIALRPHDMRRIDE